MSNTIKYDLSLLNNNLNVIKNDKVFLCCYAIFNKNSNPFLSYLLFKYSDIDLLSFIQLDNNSNIENSIKKKFINPVETW